MKKLLSENKEEAVKQLIQITNEAAEVTETEGNSVATNDAMGYTLNEATKEKALEVYQEAVLEFQAELESYRGVNGDLLDELQAAQNRLGKAARMSNEQMEQLKS